MAVMYQFFVPRAQKSACTYHDFIFGISYHQLLANALNNTRPLHEAKIAYFV